MSSALASRQAVLTRSAVPVVRRVPAVSRRNLCVVAAKGGEEGGKTFDKSVVGVLSGNANFALLASAIGKAGLAEALSGPGPFTVFAPDDDALSAACKKLKISKMELMTLPNLADILKYHVIAGKVMSKDLTEGATPKTLNGKTVKVTLAGGAKINGIKVVKADFPATNGVIHRIAEVLLP